MLSIKNAALTLGIPRIANLTRYKTLSSARYTLYPEMLHEVLPVQDRLT